MNSQLSFTRGWLAVCLSVLVALVLLPVVTPDASAKGPLLHVGQPVSYKNLTLFPVIDKTGGAKTDAYITLDEGIRSGTVVITERGGGETAMVQRGSAAVNQRISMRSDNASVNELSLINKSGKKLLLLAGEVIVGGKQDRIIEDDVVIPAISVPVSLSVFCVERGRWSQRTASASSSGATQVITPAGAARKEDNFYSLGVVAHPKLRAAAQDKKQQSEVWKEVGENNAKLGTANSTDTYQEVYASKKVSDSLESYVKALEKEFVGPNVVGVLVARNGELVWADVFASSSLFARYWPKLLKSYAVDALADQTSEKRPAHEEATRYLFEREGAAKTSGRAGIYELTRIENPRYAVFELWDISLASPLLLHFNKVQR